MKRDNMVEWTARLIAAAVFAVLVWVLTACTTQYIPVETVKYDSIFLAKIQKDSIFVQDSIYIRQEGDTVFKDKFKYIYRFILNKDTIYIERIDTIQVPVPVVKKITRWQQLGHDLGDALLKAVFIYAVYLLIRWIIKRTRKE